MSELDDAFHSAESLAPDDRLRLIARLWASLPAEHWAAPRAGDLAEMRFLLDGYDTAGMAEVPWKIVRQMAGVPPAAPATPTKIYSAPRRFDLATIFVVTFAYSILFAVMSGVNFPPVASLIVGGFITIVGVGQALLFGGLKPRSASVVTGACTYMLGTIGFWFYEPRMYPGEYMVLVITWSAIGGAVMGYIAGVLVGGVFLVADGVRRKFGRRTDPEPVENENSGTN